MTESPFASPLTLNLVVDCFLLSLTVVILSFAVAFSLEIAAVSVFLQTEQVRFLDPALNTVAAAAVLQEPHL